MDLEHRYDRLWERLLQVLDTPEKPVQAEMEADRRRVEEYLRAPPGAKVQVRAHPPSQDEPS
jgi:hypothetical protein